MSAMQRGSPFEPGSIVIVYLQNPREKVWGMLMDLGPAGISLTGLDLSSFDDWLRGLSSTEEQAIRPSVGFYPLLRVEKILLDEGAEGVPSLDAQCVARTGRGLRETLAASAGAPVVEEAL